MLLQFPFSAANCFFHNIISFKEQNPEHVDVILLSYCYLLQVGSMLSI